MNISSVSATSNNTINTTDIYDVKSLEKQQMALELQVQKIHTGKDDAKMKQDKLKQVNIQIQMIKEQIQRAKTKDFNKNNDIEKQKFLEKTHSKNSINKNEGKSQLNKAESDKENSINKEDSLNKENSLSKENSMNKGNSTNKINLIV